MQSAAAPAHASLAVRTPAQPPPRNPSLESSTTSCSSESRPSKTPQSPPHARQRPRASTGAPRDPPSALSRAAPPLSLRAGKPNPPTPGLIWAPSSQPRCAEALTRAQKPLSLLATPGVPILKTKPKSPNCSLGVGSSLQQLAWGGVGVGGLEPFLMLDVCSPSMLCQAGRRFFVLLTFLL